MRIPRSLAVAPFLLACGGTAVIPDPIVSGTVSGSYDGADFVAVNGFVTMRSSGTYVIGFGTGPIGCGSEDMSRPPPGYSAAVSLASLSVGTYSNTFVNLIANVNGFEGAGSNDGTLTVTAVGADTLSGTISYSYTDSGGATYALSGTFEVVLCAN